MARWPMLPAGVCPGGPAPKQKPITLRVVFYLAGVVVFCLARFAHGLPTRSLPGAGRLSCGRGGDGMQQPQAQTMMASWAAGTTSGQIQKVLLSIVICD